MPRNLIKSDIAIRSVKAGDPRGRINDGDGLYILLFVNGGSHGWRFDYTHEGRHKTLSLGTYPDTGLALARQKADAARRLVAAGVDPSATRKAERERHAQLRVIRKLGEAGLPLPETFEHVARQWYEQRKADWAPGYGKKAMQAHLFALSRRDLQADISRLAARLPSEIVSRATLCVIDAVDDETDLPRYIATVDELSDAQSAQLKQALDGLGVDDLQLQLGPATMPPPPPAGSGDPPASFFGVSDAELASCDARRLPVEEALKRIVEAQPSGIDYPEKGWTGAMQAAYAVFVERLGTAPMDDKGTYLGPQDVANAAEERPPGIDEQAWTAVRDHLMRELKLFRLAADWFSIRGYLHGLFTDQHLFNGDFVQQVNDKYLKLGSSKVVSIGLDVCMSLAVRAIGTIKGYGTGLAAVVSSLWIVTKGALPDPHARIDAKISEMQAQVGRIFSDSLVALSKADARLGTDWGLLDSFGRLLEQGDLVWPRDLTALRAAQSRAFQYVALQSTVHLLSGMSGMSSLEIGVVDLQVKVSGQQNGKWVGHHYLTHSVHSKGGTCGVGKGWYLREVFLGYRVISPGVPKPLQQDAAAALQAKLFGHDISDPGDPQFALTQGFLLSASDPQRSGWNLAQLPLAA